MVVSASSGLPLAPRLLPSETVVSTPAKQGSDQMQTAEPHLLITDDDSDFRGTLRSVFERRGFMTSEAADGNEAVQIVQDRDIHLVLMDMHMPKLSGLEAMRELKRFKATLPCILISGALDDRIVQEAASIPVFSVLSKPVSLAELTSTVLSALNENYSWGLE